jgi:sigma-B regulation protein RsbU (phosphoserine phosphatase)
MIAGFLLCSAIAFVGYQSFNKQFRKQYDSNIRSIAAAACECLNPDMFYDYLTLGSKDGEWDGINKILQDFVDKFELNLLYVSHVEGSDFTEITYFYNPVMKGGKWTEFPFLYSEHYEEPNYNKSAKRVFENGETIVRHTLKTRSGSHITAMTPVRNSSGQIVAVLGAQKSIQEYVDAGRKYMHRIIIVEILFAAIFFALFTFYFSHFLIKPLALITRETDHFASFGGQPSDRLLEIKNHDEIGILAHSVHQMEYDICKNMEEIKSMTAEKERISTELSVAAKIQSDMLNKDYPPYPERKDFELFAAMTPAKEVGGDLYDYLLLDDDHLMLTVGDVSGKGVPAALFMGKCKVLLDFYSYLKLSPAEIFNRANAQLCKGNESELFVTCWLGIYTFSTRELKFVNAGHPSPVLYSNGEYTWLKSKPNFVLGGMEGLQYTEHSIRLEKGDKLFVYSDGVTEATDSSNELFGDERLMEAVKNTKDMSAPQTLDSIRSKIDAFAGEAEQFDDITMLSFELKQ